MNETIVYSFPGMHCAHCEQAVAAELSAVPGVEAVEVDLDTKLVTVRGESLSDSALREAIEEAGYPTIDERPA
ncbi:MAG: heavy metal-associated domain-containing protein [Dehalococcoidia bacterium]